MNAIISKYSSIVIKRKTHNVNSTCDALIKGMLVIDTQFNKSTLRIYPAFHRIRISVFIGSTCQTLEIRISAFMTSSKSVVVQSKWTVKEHKQDETKLLTLISDVSVSNSIQLLTLAKRLLTDTDLTSGSQNN